MEKIKYIHQFSPKKFPHKIHDQNYDVSYEMVIVSKRELLQLFFLQLIENNILSPGT